MANENEKNPSALEELRRLKRTHRIKSLDIHEPELHVFLHFVFQRWFSFLALHQYGKCFQH